MTAAHANLAEIKDLAGDIYNLWRNRADLASLADAGAEIEGQMDGSQPANLVSEAVALASKWSA